MKLKKLLEREVLILIAVVLFFYIGFNINTIRLIEPNNVIDDRSPEFKWYGNKDSYRLLVDNNADFENSLVDVSVEESFYQINRELDIGTYYWKVIADDLESVTGMFVVESFVSVKLEEDKLQNVGNVPINITIKEKIGGSWSIVGAAVLDVREVLEREDNNETLYEAEQND